MKKKYPITLSMGTRLFITYHASYGRIVSTCFDLYDPTADRTGSILTLCGKSMMELDGRKHNGFSWFCVREDVTLDDFEISFQS